MLPDGFCADGLLIVWCALLAIEFLPVAGCFLADTLLVKRTLFLALQSCLPSVHAQKDEVVLSVFFRIILRQAVL